MKPIDSKRRTSSSLIAIILIIATAFTYLYCMTPLFRGAPLLNENALIDQNYRLEIQDKTVALTPQSIVQIDPKELETKRDKLLDLRRSAYNLVAKFNNPEKGIPLNLQPIKKRSNPDFYYVALTEKNAYLIDLNGVGFEEANHIEGKIISLLQTAPE